MATVIRTSDLPARSRHDAWRDVVCDTLGPPDLRIDLDAPLRGEIELGQLGPVGVGRVATTTPHSVHRTARLIHRDNPELYRAVLAVSGEPVLRQDGREIRLAKGEFAIYDFTRPYEVAYDAAVRLAVFSFPHELLPLPHRDVARLTAVPVSASSGAGALAVPLLRRVATDHDEYTPASAARLATVVMDLVTTALAERAEQGEAVPEDARRRTLLLRVRAFIDQRLGWGDLDPVMVAAAHHVSVRYLHRLFESENTTVAAWIRHRRLERCRADPLAARHLTVSEVGARWGLPDAAHFSRLFKRAYGLPPAEFRRAHPVR
ncbi:AraC family transcriptional regulator [Nonomuraea sp. WAC 01424]|uniref:AraC-like ligand-binding domain-containing protein n=1 Tax=Nonomuraea sp. WAC 01424 TaxID=2203200 RepID=UPI000F7AC055|nr:helix-turn-helix domain-containing protein [Nonomuraea sp. WAC 01424]RSN16055.1 AraC family transcriptional regulator [Nonomuraea sp. WAC 01424]